MGQVVHLSRARIPDGRALLFGKALFEISTLTGDDAMRVTHDLYDTKRDLPKPIVVALKDGIDPAAFERLSEEHGIIALIREA